MSLTPNSVAVPAQSKSLDTSTVTIGGMFDYELPFTTGLTFRLDGGTAADITVIFE